MTQSASRLTGLSGIADQFDAAILDQWGVLHDGAKAPPGAIEAVTALAAAGKRLVVLSNSARLGADAASRLKVLGFDPDVFSGLVTSGETVRDMLRDRDDPFFAALGRNVLLIARDDTLIRELDYQAVETVDAADFLLLGSSTAPELSLAEHHAPVLAAAVARGLPLICSNPDRVGLAATGFIEGPGLLAAHYETLGGTVRYIGKPHPEVYARAMQLLGQPAPARTLTIGDSLEHDIAGGRTAGCRTVFIEAGIHASDFATPDGPARLYTRYGVEPDFILSRLLW